MAKVHEKRIEFRAAGSLVEMAQRDASKRGMTFSEFVRDAMRLSLETSPAYRCRHIDRAAVTPVVGSARPAAGMGVI